MWCGFGWLFVLAFQRLANVNIDGKVCECVCVCVLANGENNKPRGDLETLDKPS